MQCPKCSYEPTLSEQQSSPDKCPRCEVIYSKVKTAEAPVVNTPTPWAQRKAVELQAAGISKAPLSSSVNSVSIVDIKMPFWSMVSFMVKWAIASIPALIILIMIFSAISIVFAGFFKAL